MSVIAIATVAGMTPTTATAIRPVDVMTVVSGKDYNRLSAYVSWLIQKKCDAGERGKCVLLWLDEIQNVEGWLLFVNRLLRKKIHVVLTGSNAKLLSSDLATHLTGRSSEVELYPFSFAEYCVMKNVDCTLRTTKGIALQRNAVDEYVKNGGFPELLSIKNGKRLIIS